MKKTKKSISYKDAFERMDEIDKEVAYMELWRFSYASRHVQQSLWEEKRLDEEIERTLKWSSDITEKYCPETKMQKDYSHTLTFLNCLIYGYHRQEINDGYIDLRYESLLWEYDNPIEKVTPEEVIIVKNLHDLSYKFGYLILELYAKPDHTVFWDWFVRKPRQKPTSIPPYYRFPEKGNCPQGVQIALSKYDTNINENWDLIIYYSEGDKISHIKKDLDNRWNEKVNVLIGKKPNHDIAFYIDRETCKKTHALDVLEFQIGLWRFELSGRSAVFRDGTNNAPKFTNNHEEPKNFMANTVDAFRISEKLTEKRWKSNKNNVRRSIGIYHWDKIHSPEPTAAYIKPLIRDTISRLHRNNPSVLNEYHTNYTKLMTREPVINFKAKDEFIETIIREMERDYKLTDHCIKNADYIRPAQV